MDDQLPEKLQMLSGDLDGVSKVLSVLLLKCAEAEKRLEYTKAEQFIESMERNMMRYMKEAGGVTESIKVMNLEAQQDQAWKAIFGDTDNSIRKLKQKLRELREADGV